MHLTKYEKEAIILKSEGYNTYDIFTYNVGLKRKLANYAKRYQDLCKLTKTNDEGGHTYVISKARVSICLTVPYSEERLKIASGWVKLHGMNRNQQN